AEASLLKPLRHQAQSRTVPPDQLHPVRSLGAEHIDDPGKRVGTILRLHQRGEGVRSFTKIHRPRRNQDARIRPRADHRVALSAAITAEIVSASAPCAIFTVTPSISSSTAALDERRERRRGRCAGAATCEATGSITAGTNIG